MAVRRHVYDRAGSVYAFRNDLGAWSRRLGVTARAVVEAAAALLRRPV